ncbi:FMN-binding glutamate synthase family protein [Aliiglaciecola sp. 3_MG-2023]|uniref:FMN-binding glutamate synthase family protein n=1 Tax=Aliiglaciecola sp. 3_MG-2023 TaxID=3062644 RepID=UPI0026E13E8E|nr:FMN-binding glutamate synthase family protein [Aliiglaciecola sp. 3_MG-2023]MDO6693524.1 FMN-binding glutamate synthase family protein [Aliiglaciecola sp. 3_MG-2023]
MRLAFYVFCFLSWGLLILASNLWSISLWGLIILIPLTIVGFYDIFQCKHALLRNFPVVGHGRWLMEDIRPFLRQYFFESETDGVPVNRMFRSVIYQRAKGQLDSLPYGTKLHTQNVGYEWISHSVSAIHYDETQEEPRVKVGGPDCKQPYEASVFNISAMSFGALSANAIRALNKGAKLGNFYHNTGEGSVSPYHLENGGDLVWQIGTGYFGCRDNKGKFAPEAFQQVAQHQSIKMIEIKLSQGAKPGHGGILPADKNTPEIARIRLVEPGTRVDSPPGHSAFSSPLEMMDFIQQLRDLSGGKPIGFKLCIGQKSEFVAMCKAMLQSGIKPDFITVDGGEGGTGAAPLEYSNSVGMPLREALVYVCDILQGFDLKKDIKVIASGKAFTGFHVVRNIAVGADICNSARGMMMALGCVQSLVCNTNHCPTGIATQNKHLAKGIVVEDKAQRVARYHQETVHATLDIVSSAGLSDYRSINRGHIYRRISQTEIKRYDEIYPSLVKGCLLTDDYPQQFEKEMQESSVECFMPKSYVLESSRGLKTKKAEETLISSKQA